MLPQGSIASHLAHAALFGAALGQSARVRTPSGDYDLPLSILALSEHPDSVANGFDQLLEPFIEWQRHRTNRASLERSSIDEELARIDNDQQEFLLCHPDPGEDEISYFTEKREQLSQKRRCLVFLRDPTTKELLDSFPLCIGSSLLVCLYASRNGGFSSKVKVGSPLFRVLAHAARNEPVIHGGSALIPPLTSLVVQADAREPHLLFADRAFQKSGLMSQLLPVPFGADVQMCAPSGWSDRISKALSCREEARAVHVVIEESTLSSLREQLKQQGGIIAEPMAVRLLALTSLLRGNTRMTDVDLADAIQMLEWLAHEESLRRQRARAMEADQVMDQKGKILLAKIRAKGPIRFRNLARSCNNQRGDTLKPVLEYLQERKLIAVNRGVIHPVDPGALGGDQN